MKHNHLQRQKILDTQTHQVNPTTPPIVTSQNYCPINDQWKTTCLQDRGPCDLNAGVGIPYHCENNVWHVKQSECSTTCVVKQKNAPSPSPTPTPIVANFEGCIINNGIQTFIKKGESYCDTNSFLYSCDGNNKLTSLACGAQGLVCVQNQNVYNARCSQPPTVDSASYTDPCIINPQICSNEKITFTAYGTIINKGRGSFSDLFIKLGVLSQDNTLRFIGTPEDTTIQNNGSFETKLTMSKNEASVFANQCNMYIFNKSTNEILGSETQMTLCSSVSPMLFNVNIEYPFYIPETPTATPFPTPFPTSTPLPPTPTATPKNQYGTNFATCLEVSSVDQCTAIYRIPPTPIPTLTSLPPTPTLTPQPTLAVDKTNYSNSNSVVYWASLISGKLEPGSTCNNDWCRMVTKISNGSTTSTYREGYNDGTGSTGRYWCTTFAKDSFTLAGKIGPNTESVATMVSYWENSRSSLYYPYFSSNDKEKILESIAPGCLLFDETTHRTFTGDEHVAVVEKINIYDQPSGTGEVVTFDGNRNIKEWHYPFENWQIHNNKYNFVSFGCF